MDTGFLLLLLGAGALAVLSDMFVSSNAETEAAPEPAMPKEKDDTSAHRVILGTEENDRFDSKGGETIFGLGGDDVLTTYGDSILFGGEGDDVLVSVGGGAVLNGGAGADIFRIELLGVRDDGTLLDFCGQPVAPTVIDDFSPDSDRLVLDLLDSSLLPNGSEPVVLTGISAPNDEGLMVQVNGVNVVQLSSYGGGDMQAALEALFADFGALEVVGAAFEFPPDPYALPNGVNLDFDDTQIVFNVNEDYSGGGTLALPSDPDLQGLPATINLSALVQDAAIVFDDDGNGTLTVADLPPTQIIFPISTITLGKGDDTIDLQRANEAAIGPNGVTINATDGINDINIGRSIDGVFNLSGGDNTVLAKGATVNITGGDNTLISSKSSTNTNFNITLEPNADSTTTVEGTRVRLTVVYKDLKIAQSRVFEADPPLDDFEALKSYKLTWDGGQFEADQLRWVIEDFSSFYDPTLPANVEVFAAFSTEVDPLATFNDNRSLVFVVGDDFAGGGTFDGSNVTRGGLTRGLVDLTGFTGNVTIEDDQFGQPLLIVEGQEANPTLLKDVRSVILGSGENIVTSADLRVMAQDGQNRIEADTNEIRRIRLEGGVNEVTQRGSGTLRAQILGGENTLFISDNTDARIGFFQDTTGNTFIRGGASSSVTFSPPGPETSIVVTDSGIAASWTDGNAALDGRGQPIALTVKPGTTIDLTKMTESMSYELRIFVLSDAPDVTIIGELNDNITIAFFEDD